MLDQQSRLQVFQPEECDLRVERSWIAPQSQERLSGKRSLCQLGSVSEGPLEWKRINTFSYGE